MKKFLLRKTASFFFKYSFLFHFPRAEKKEAIFSFLNIFSFFILFENGHCRFSVLFKFSFKFYLFIIFFFSPSRSVDLSFILNEKIVGSRVEKFALFVRKKKVFWLTIKALDEQKNYIETFLQILSRASQILVLNFLSMLEVFYVSFFDQKHKVHVLASLFDFL